MTFREVINSVPMPNRQVVSILCLVHCKVPIHSCKTFMLCITDGKVRLCCKTSKFIEDFHTLLNQSYHSTAIQTELFKQNSARLIEP